MIHITPLIAIDERDISETFIRASGPGGQNVNKVSTAVELRYPVGKAGFPDDMSKRLARLAGRQLALDNTLVITAQEHRSQERNRATALAKLVDLLRRAAERPKKRIATRPTKASRTRRLDSKARRSTTKTLRRARPAMD
jgi:ribosome-associated protein